ncbi:hypothetical protein ANN_27504 [Periplaneta americana]|uniref:Uncharacterized protein n=1 Tax=Periplaneta americana TaxID=6978 RepID=A0ABQ8RVW9_PERAM|nr:hypothetical protein ANN_27504 [Periplaneta americana]
MRILRKASPKSREIAYLTLVRPLMEYGTTCWDPYRIYQINSLERIQYRAAKFVKGKREDGNYTIKELKWETLENRRRKTRITSLYIAHLGQKAWVDITARLEKPMYYGRNDHDFKIKCRKQKTDVGVMDVIKMEPEVDPVTIQTSDIADIEGRKPLSEEENLLDLHVTEIKTEYIDHRYDLGSEIAFEESAVPIDFLLVKSEAEENSCELDQVEEEVKLEIMVEEDEVITEGLCASLRTQNDSNANSSSGTENISEHEACLNLDTGKPDISTEIENWSNSVPQNIIVMDVIKIEPGCDPLAAMTSDNSDVQEKKTLSEEGNLLDLDVTKIKTECVDHRYDIKSEIVFEESAVPIDFPMLKSEAEEEFRELDQVKEFKLEVTAEENEVLTESLLSKNLKVRIYKTVILPVVLYACETWTLTLREEHRLRVFENKVLRKIFGAKRDEFTGEWRKLHNTELHELYSSPDIIRNIKSRRLRWAGHVARMGESRNAYRVLVVRLEGKRPLGRPRRRWEDNMKMDLREVE